MLPDLQFDEAKHEYTVAGVRWPSVTEVLDPLLELDGIPREFLEAAAQFGSHVHHAVHLWNEETLDEDSLDPALTPYLAAWKTFLFRNGARVLTSELRVAHPKLRYAGTLDSIIAWRGAVHLVDIKTGANIPATVGPQTAAYREAYLQSNRAVSAIRYCVHLLRDGTYRLKKLDDRGDFNLFLSALNIHNWRKNRAN